MVCGVRPHAIALLINAAIHVSIFVIYGAPMHQLWRFVLSFFFFIYPCSYMLDIFWSVRPAVRRVLTGEVLINRKHFMNAPRREVKASDLFPITVSIPVYLEENKVIFETVERGLLAIQSYRSYGATDANVLISEDGLAPLLGGVVTKERIESILNAFEKNPESLSAAERKAAERIRFYRSKGVAFIARPAKGRAGLPHHLFQRECRAYSRHSRSLSSLIHEGILKSYLDLCHRYNQCNKDGLNNREMQGFYRIYANL